MTEVTIPTGGNRDGWIVISVNGVPQWIKAGDPTELDDSEIEVLNHAGVSYSLPDGTEPYVVIDLENGAYTVGGGTVALADVLGEDLVNWNTYDPADVTSEPGGGYSASGEGPVIIGDALAYLLAGKTVIVDFTAVETNDYLDIKMFSEDFSMASQWKVGTATTFFAGFPTPSMYWPPETEAPGAPLDAGRHKVAFTHTDGYHAWSIDGGDAAESATSPWTPPPEFFGIYMESEGPTAILHSIKVYPAQNMTVLAELSAL